MTMQKTAIVYFLLKNSIHTLPRATKIGIRMDWDANSVQLKNHENWEMFRYPQFETLLMHLQPSS